MHEKAKSAGGMVLATSLMLSACGGSGDPVPDPTLPATQALACDDSLKAAFRPDANTEVLAVKQFKAGDAYPNATLENIIVATAPTKFSTDLCLVTLKVGPGSPGPAGAPSTSQGIGIEVWLPPKASWTGRVVSLGGTGWAGGEELDLTKISSNSVSGDVGYRSAPRVAAEESVVTSTTDVGKLPGGGAFGLLPDRTINTVGWENFSDRGLREQAIKTKALATAFYGSAPKYMYFSGASGGGRQAMHAAQRLSEYYDGILAAVPGISWTRLFYSLGYPQIVVHRDLGGTAPTAAQQRLMANAAISACDVVGGQHLGFVLDPAACRYDPTKDENVLCTTSGGINTSADCVSTAQATAMNKVWYGMTTDGSVPDPAVDNGWADTKLTGVRKWFGPTRGSITTGSFSASGSLLAGDMIANTFLDPTMAIPSFLNASGNGQNKYLSLSFAELNRGYDLALTMQPQWSYINTENPDLSALKGKGGKMIAYVLSTDTTVPPQGLMKYFDDVTSLQGSVAATQSFFRLYILPSVSHNTPFLNGSANTAAAPPIAEQTKFWQNLQNWVEKGTPPPQEILATPSSASRAMTLPLCAYPSKPSYQSGSPFSAASYVCQ